MPESTAIAILRLLTEKPPPHKRPNKRGLTVEQTRLLSVLSDEWLEHGTPGGQLLAERLRGPLSDSRCLELGFETWLGICSLHRLVLFLMPERVFEAIAAAGDERLAFRLVAWLKVERPKSALHALVAKRAWRALHEVEAHPEAAPVISEPGSHCYPLPGLTAEFGREENGEFLGVNALSDADGFQIEIERLSEGPLAALNSYRPPPARYEPWRESDEW